MMRCLAGWLLVLVFALIYGWVGECDRQDAESYARVRAEIAAAAPLWVESR